MPADIGRRVRCDWPVRPRISHDAVPAGDARAARVARHDRDADRYGCRARPSRPRTPARRACWRIGKDEEPVTVDADSLTYDREADTLHAKGATSW